MSDRTFISRTFAITACVALLVIIIEAARIVEAKGIQALPEKLGDRVNDLLILIFGGLLAWVAKSTFLPPNPPSPPPAPK